MTYKCWSIKRILAAVLLAVVLSVASGFDHSAQTGLRYGPNMSWSLMGNTPFVWGQWLPQLEGRLHYTWLEPLDSLNYGDILPISPSYLKMEGALEVSPFYGGYIAGLGLRPFKTNPQVEMNFTYESYLYFRSNLEMVTADVEGGGRIAETWNADYVVDNAWNEDSEFDYAQLFDFGISVDYAFPGKSMIGIAAHYTLSDVSTDFDGKSFDYRRNIPVFSRDFFVEFDTYGLWVWNENLSWIFESSYFRTGFLRSGSSVAKESLGYGLVMAGPQISWMDGLRCLTLELGGWRRHKDRFYDGSVSQEFLIQLEYKGYFSFPIHQRLAE